MATLYDLELQESNNFIHALVENGETPALKLILDQKNQAASMGEVGQVLLAQFEDSNSDIGKTLTRLQAIRLDVQAAMTHINMTTDLAAKANQVFSRSPETLSELNEEDQNIIKEYWLKKKEVIVFLLQKGYTQEELFA